MKANNKFVALIFIVIVLVSFLGFIGYRYIQKQTADNSWITDFGYKENEIYSLTFNWPGERSCPEIPIEIQNNIYKLGFDTGCGAGIFLTDVIEDKINYTLLGEVEELNRDGSHRGWSKQVEIEQFTLFGNDYKNIETAISDWKMYSSKEFNGTIGLEYFESKIITVDYIGHRIGISNNPINYDNLNHDKYTVLPLYKSTSKSEENLPFFEAELDGKKIMIYLDTGKNYSYLYNKDSQYSISDKPEKFIDVPIILGDDKLILKDLTEVHNLAQAPGLPYPTMIELNSDQIWKNNLLVTFDLIEQKIIFR